MSCYQCSMKAVCIMCLIFLFFNDTATTEIYTLALHDTLPIRLCCIFRDGKRRKSPNGLPASMPDRKSTRLNSSHLVMSYAVLCLKKKKKKGGQGHLAPAQQTYTRCLITTLST